MKIMKKTSIALLAAAAALFSACHQPEFVESSADRQGLTSLTAIFTFGPYEDQELAKLVIDDDTQERFVIPVPYYFPETSDDETTPYMTSVRVQAELQPNFKLSPALGILDLTEENWFTYTNPKGQSHKICITGTRKKSSACDIDAFTLQNPTVAGVINKETKHIILPTKDDVSNSYAVVQLSAHATISPNPAVSRSYSNPVQFTVTAHDGTEAVYTIETGEPEKLDFGLNASSFEALFALDPVSRMSLADYTQTVYPSLAYSGGNLIISLANGTEPLMVNGLNGTKTGTLKTGGLPIASITNDDSEHIVLCSLAQGGDVAEDLTIWKMAGTSATPQQVCKFINPADCPVGHKLKVFGNIDTDAVITLTVEGIDGVTSCSKFISVKIKDGVAEEPQLYDLLPTTGLAWGAAPVNVATVIPASLNPETDGWLLDYYEGGTQELDMLQYINPSLAATPLVSYGDALAWGYNANCLDSKEFNGVRYAALAVVSHFPMWGIGPMTYLFEITDPSAPAEIASQTDIKWYQQGAAGVAGGDVILAPSADGFKMYMYFYDHNSQSVGGFVVDCIKR